MDIISIFDTWKSQTCPLRQFMIQICSSKNRKVSSLYDICDVPDQLWSEPSTSSRQTQPLPLAWLLESEPSNQTSWCRRHLVCRRLTTRTFRPSSCLCSTWLSSRGRCGSRSEVSGSRTTTGGSNTRSPPRSRSKVARWPLVLENANAIQIRPHNPCGHWRGGAL